MTVCFSGEKDHGLCKGGIVKGEVQYLNSLEIEGTRGLRSSLRNFSDFPFPQDTIFDIF